MASSKLKEDELSASISKSMTIDKLKEELKNANVSISGLKKKEDYVHRYISNGLHNGASVTTASVTTAKATTKAATSVTSPKAPPKLSMAARMREFRKEHAERKAREAEEAESKAVKAEAESKAVKAEAESKAVKAEAKEELILSLMISAHGGESYEFIPHTPVAEYYKNNVRVYSRACVPGVLSLRDRRSVRKSIDNAFTIFSNNPGKATQEVMAEYTGVDRGHYRKFLDSFTECPTYQSTLKNKERCGGLSTYLSQKQFTFTDPISSKPIMESDHNWKQFVESRGLNVSDIRLKVTASDGSVTYRNIFNPYENMAHYYRYIDNGDPDDDSPDMITKFNLIYRHGLEFILKDVLHKEELIGPALEIFKFKEGEKKISGLDLEQLYKFFKLVGIKYVNIIDHSCRYFYPNIGLTEKKAEELFEKEQQYSVKPTAFGKRLRRNGKRTKRRNNKKISDGKLTKGKRSRKHGIN
jgi:hypothetical protein